MQVGIYDAKTRLSRLVDRAAQGEEIVITRHGKPVARLVSIEPRQEPRKLGLLRGRAWISPDFDAPLPEDLLDLFEGKGE